MIMAVLGLAALLINKIKLYDCYISRHFLALSLWAIVVSIIAYASTVINHTPETTYTTYIISMWVWTGGAYFMISCIKAVHKKIGIVLVVNYMIAVCLFQCVCALLNQGVPAFDNFVKSIVGNMGFAKSIENLSESGRLYGFGAALDVAGTRFAAILAALAVVVTKLKDVSKTTLSIYIFSFIFISVIANIISRTTIVGCGIAICYWILISFFKLQNNQGAMALKTLRTLILLLLISLPFIIYLYNTNATFYNNMRFGFEGFFSIYETGSWRTNSNDILENMYKLPETLHTWLIGDGYFGNPGGDPYYIGYAWKGFYMGTDVGYLRFIFYFGIFGLISFSIYMIKVAQSCMHEFPKYWQLFAILLVINFVIWLKVSTDIFVIFAPFLCFSRQENEEYENLTYPTVNQV